MRGGSTLGALMWAACGIHNSRLDERPCLSERLYWRNGELHHVARHQPGILAGV
jgi:hypothetical protein